MAVRVAEGRLWLPGLLVLTTLAYVNGLVGPLQFDDHLLETDRAAREWAAWRDTVTWLVRPLLKASFIVSRDLGEALGSVPLGHHLLGLGIHLVCVVLAFTVARDTISSLSPGMPGTMARAAAAGCAAVLAVHPLGTEAVTYISGRSVALATLFCLCGMTLHIHGSRDGARTSRCLWTAAAAVCYAGAVLAREAMILLPAAVFVWEWSRLDLPGAPFGAPRLLPALKPTRPYLVLGAVAALWLALHPGYGNLVEVSRVIVQGRVAEPSMLAALEYFAAGFVLLAPLSIDPSATPHSMDVLRRLALLFALAGPVVWAWLGRRERAHWLFGFAWVLIFLAPVYLVPLRHDPVSDRHFYPALFGIGLAIAIEGARIAARGTTATRYAAGVAGFLVCVMFGATVVRNADYSSEVALWESAARVSPAKPRVFHNLGVAHMKEHRWDLAIPCFERALALDPGYRSAREHLDRAALKLGTGNPNAEPEI
jgi:tetratricopeptide (TPR) repeat protein